MNLKILGLAAIILLAPTCEASAQCAVCAAHPELDPLNGGALTPAGKMGLVNAHGAASTSNGPSGLAAARNQYLDVSDAQAASPKKHTRHPSAQ